MIGCTGTLSRRSLSARDLRDAASFRDVEQKVRKEIFGWAAEEALG
jgi:hypothetical protein